jgi:hypothetical protein
MEAQDNLRLLQSAVSGFEATSRPLGVTVGLEASEHSIAAAISEGHL